MNILHQFKPPGITVIDIHPDDDASRARAKAARNKERADALWKLIGEMFNESDNTEADKADVLARILGAMQQYVDLDANDHIRHHFAKWALLTLRGSAFDAGQFRTLVTASREAAQAAENCSARIERYEAVELTDPYHSAVATYWNQVSQAVIARYLDVLGKPSLEPTFTVTEARFLDPLPEVPCGDPRRI